MVVFNRVTDALQSRWPSFQPNLAPALFPVFLASLDYFEDSLQVCKYRLRATADMLVGAHHVIMNNSIDFCASCT